MQVGFGHRWIASFLLGWSHAAGLHRRKLIAARLFVARTGTLLDLRPLQRRCEVLWLTIHQKPGRGSLIACWLLPVTANAGHGTGLMSPAMPTTRVMSALMLIVAIPTPTPIETTSSAHSMRICLSIVLFSSKLLLTTSRWTRISARWLHSVSLLSDADF